jgi:hypothetical protein
LSLVFYLVIGKGSDDGGNNGWRDGFEDGFEDGSAALGSGFLALVGTKMIPLKDLDETAPIWDIQPRSTSRRCFDRRTILRFQKR